ncbi:DUF645 family protein [Bacillus thuringiensis]|nr:DUF645 family protein [Bacillus thuringiensis]MCC4032421.1 DUF645 family protein [Bacillus thuringiensis]
MNSRFSFAAVCIISLILFSFSCVFNFSCS